MRKYKNLSNKEGVEEALLKQLSDVFNFQFHFFDEVDYLFDCISYPRFRSKNNKGGREVLCPVNDFDVIYHDFKTIGIDLIDSDIDWVKFNFHLTGFMNSQSSAIALRMQERETKKEETSFRITKALNY